MDETNCKWSFRNWIFAGKTSQGQNIYPVKRKGCGLLWWSKIKNLPLMDLLTPEFQLPEMTDVTLFVLMIGHNTSLSSSWWDFDMAFYYLLFYQNLEHIVVEFSPFFSLSHTVWKILKMSHLNLWILAFSTNFCPIKTDLSGITVWPQALVL